MSRTIFIACCVLLGSWVAPLPAAGAGELLALQATALGEFPEGRILRLSGRISEPGYSGDFTWRTMRPGMVRVTLVLAPDKVFEEGFDGEQAWEKPMSATEARIANDDAREALRQGTVWLGHYRPLQEIATMGLEVEVLAPERLDGVDYDRVRVGRADGDATIVYLDPGTHLIARTRTVKALHAGVDPDDRKGIETVLGDWRAVGSLMVAFSSVDREIATGRELMRTEWQAASWEPGDASVFRLPH